MSSRTENTARNIVTGLVSKFSLTLLAFLTKTIFIRLLGAEYNGISGLYSNILSMLTLAELGIGQVLNFSLYQALKEGDHDSLTVLISSFRKIYRGIALFIAVVGILLVPLLPYIVDNSFPTEKIIIYYLLYLLDTVCSYLFVYKTTIITSDQKNYINTLVQTALKTAMYALQIVYLLVRKDFLGYLIIQIACTFISNFLLSRIAERMYPYIKNRTSSTQDTSVKQMIVSNVKATFIYKISGTLLNSTDNILISAMIGTASVGYYSNYHVLIVYVNSFISVLSNGMAASLGNLNAEHDSDISYGAFESTALLYGIVTTFCTCCFASCIQKFIPIWIGKEYLLSDFEVFAFLLVFYFAMAVGTPTSLFRATMGLFREVRYVLLFASLLNIGLSVVLGNIMGLAGIVLATVVAKALTQYWYEPIVLYRKFGRRVSTYFLTQLKYAVCTGLCLAVVLSVSQLLPETLPWLFIRVGICAVTVGAFEIAFNFYTQEYKDLIKKLKVIVAARKK